MTSRMRSITRTRIWSKKGSRMRSRMRSRMGAK